MQTVTFDLSICRKNLLKAHFFFPLQVAHIEAVNEAMWKKNMELKIALRPE